MVPCESLLHTLETAMNSRERVAAAMQHEVPDRVPVMCQLALGHYFLHSRHAPAEIWFDSEVFVRTLREFQQRYRFDGLLVNVPGRPERWRTISPAGADSRRRCCPVRCSGSACCWEA